MTPDLSRQLAHMANEYESHKEVDYGLCVEFRRYVRQHEDDIDTLEDIPAKYKSIIE